ncbi:type VI secretion system protein TssA [Pseudomonas sp. BJa5]|uniref:type VI secretion system protein TssA n=1 Tax=Pseudomonas sp. BJa5 TaxID=2936270 RepID=UPI00255A31FE|nr:type VI secretion system protein TssA [Pseudomonas sp. BGr12]MDL2423415.1 type VI secretion system protein TssA [Pseudomonas sp. BGr12]
MNLQSLIETCLGDRDPLALARDQGQRWEAWLQPISEHEPVGQDPGYNDDFQRMRAEVNKLSGADTERVVQLAQQLLSQTCKDLRVVTYYLWARLHRDGEAGLADGLNLLAALIERYPATVLPTRPNGRKAALEWLASAKVLDCLSRFPQVVKVEAQCTVAALAWLEHGLAAWPQDQRPSLGGLCSALSIRLTQSGGVDAVVPQTSASQVSSVHVAGPSVAAIQSGRDLLDAGRLMAGYLREQPEGWLAAHRLMKSLRWDTVHQPPPQDANGITRLAPPRSEYRAQLKRLYLQQRWDELLVQVEKVFAEGVNHFWLDLQWYLHQALGKQPAPAGSWADIVERDLGMFLERLPGLELQSWSDASPFAEPTTREWITQQVSANRSAQWLAAPAIAPASADSEILALEDEALAQADSEGVERALGWLAARPEVRSGRQRWLLRLLMARVAEQYGKSELAVHLLDDLEVTARRQAMTEWEPALDFEVKARLLKLLRLRSQRNDVDKPALARRMDALLAGLVAIDPVRAAVLCG